MTSNTDGRKIKHFQYKSDASATQAEVANGLFKSAINNFSKEAEAGMGFEMLCNDAGATDGTATTVDVVNGSKTGTLNAGATTFVVGDFLRIGGGATTDPVYKITALSGTTVTLDAPYQGATASGVTIEYITAALAAAADCGVMITGVALSFSVGKFFYKKSRWEMSLKDFGTTTSAREADASAGSGQYEEVAEKEWFLAGFEGEYFRMGEPAIHNFVGVADSSTDYSVVTIVFEDKSLVGFENNISPKMLSIAVPDDNGGGGASAWADYGTTDSLSEVLEDLGPAGTDLSSLT